MFQHDGTAHEKRKFQGDNITKCEMVVAVQTERPEILKEG